MTTGTDVYEHELWIGYADLGNLVRVKDLHDQFAAELESRSAAGWHYVNHAYTTDEDGDRVLTAVFRRFKSG